MGLTISTSLGVRRATNVGELRKALDGIPDDTPLELMMEYGVEVVLEHDRGAPEGHISRVSFEGYDPAEADDGEDDDDT
ncbi:MAG: hypothetical protein RLZZ127_41 [Planctomycetota bacterium]|jgi:hypothetical protein